MTGSRKHFAGGSANAAPDDDAPELTEEMAERAEAAIGGKVIRRGRPPLATSERKVQVTLRLEPGLLAWYKESGPGWQLRMQKALETYAWRDATRPLAKRASSGMRLEKIEIEAAPPRTARAAKPQPRRKRA